MARRRDRRAARGRGRGGPRPGLARLRRAGQREALAAHPNQPDERLRSPGRLDLRLARRLHRIRNAVQPDRRRRPAVHHDAHAEGGRARRRDRTRSVEVRSVRRRAVVVDRDRVFVTYRNFLWALDRRTGEPVRSFGAAGRIDLRDGLDQPAEKLTVSASTPGVIFEDLLIMGSTVPETLPGSPGHIRAFDANTGKLRWIFHTIPQPGEFGYDTWPKDAWQISGGSNAWAGLSVDAKAGMVFAATGSASFDFYGANRHGDDLFANC